MFLWAIRKYPTHNERHDVEYKIPIQYINGGQLLLVQLGYCRSGYTSSVIPSIRSRIIEKCICKALDCGWDFKLKHPPLELDCLDIMSNDRRDLTDQFIPELEKIQPESSSDVLSLKHIIEHARYLMTYNEHKIALEDTIENLSETGILLHKELAQLALDAFAAYGDDSYVI